MQDEGKMSPRQVDLIYNGVTNVLRTLINLMRLLI